MNRMVEPRSRASGRRRRHRWFVLIGILVAAAMGAVLAVRSQLFVGSPKWEDIQRAASGGRWAEVDAQLGAGSSFTPKTTGRE